MNISPINNYSQTPLLSIVNSNISANSGVRKSLNKMSTGLNIVNSADSPSGLAMSERMRSLIVRYEAAIDNVDNSISYIETTDGYTQTVHNMSGRMQELAIAANDGTKSDTERSALQAEFQQLQEGIQDITSGDSALAQYNGTKLLQGETTTVAVGAEQDQVQTISGIDLSINNTDTIGNDSQGNPVTWQNIIATNGSGIDISTQQGASQAGEALSLATNYISESRATLGATQNRLQHSATAVREAQVNTIMSESNIRDADIAKEMINFTKFLTLGKTTRNLLGAATGQLIATA